MPHSETGYTRRPATAGVIFRRAVPAGRAEMNPRRGGWLQAWERPKGRLLESSRRRGRGPGGSSPKTEHPRFLVHVADLARLETGPSAWTGAGGAATTLSSLLPLPHLRPPPPPAHPPIMTRSQYRTSNPENSPVGASSSTDRPDTRAPAGPWRHHSAIRDTAPASPSTTASTRPSPRLRTQPPAPFRVASARRACRKKTPCTLPLTCTSMRRLPPPLPPAGPMACARRTA